jgi:hypothetical protein
VNFSRISPPLLKHAFSTLFTIEVLTSEARIILAIEAIRSTKKLSRLAASKLYRVLYSTLTDRINGRTTLSKRRPGTTKLSLLEEEVIIQHILDLYSREFAPRLAGVEDIAKYILESREGGRVSKLWAHRFIRQPALKTRFNRVYDF